MLSISGYGRSGPLAGFRAYASNINNFLGQTTAWAPDGIHFDFVAGIHGACAVVAALAEVGPGIRRRLHRHGPDRGRCAPWCPSSTWTSWPTDGSGAPGPTKCRARSSRGSSACRGADAWVAVELEDARDWEVLCTFFERPGLEPGGRGVDAVHRAVEAWAATVTPLQAASALQELGLAAGPVQDSEDLWRDPQHRSRAPSSRSAIPTSGLWSIPTPRIGYAATRVPPDQRAQDGCAHGRGVWASGWAAAG